jgi:protein disulfide-isomerase-like protein
VTVRVNGAEDSAVFTLTKDLFDQKMKEGPMLVEFFAPWCGHCKHLEPIWEELAKELKNRAVIAKVDCVQERELQQIHQIRGFPTIKFFKDGIVHDYKGGRDVPSFVSFLRSHNAIKESGGAPAAISGQDGQKDSELAELRYFGARGRAEVIRLLLEELGIRYLDTRFDNEEWPKHKQNTHLFPFGQVPSLSIDGHDLVQTGAITRYLGRKYGMYGDNNLETTMIDLVIGGFEDLQQKYSQLVYDPEFEVKKHKYISEVLPVWLAHYQRLLMRNGGVGFFVGNRLTIADIYGYDILTLQLELVPNCLQQFFSLQQFYARMESRPNISTYLHSVRRPRFAHGATAFWNNEKKSSSPSLSLIKIS